ncbi:MAG TPA: squalene--hopene cyclase [Bryobacteraceae bacterium]|nr:squalene--hopene cyclase [Bryobacteraceae bacterium]
MSSGYFESDRRGSLQDAVLTAAEERRVLTRKCGEAAMRSAEALIAVQKPEGYWVGDLLADTTLESDYVLLQLWMYPPRDGQWSPPTRPQIRNACRSILARQLPDGGFNIFPGGPADINASVKAYTALKLAGFDADADFMRRLRDRILALGGIQAANSYVKINLSLFGLYPRAYVPTVPPELVLLAGHILYEMSSWTRAIVVPLSIVQAIGGTRPVPRGFHLDELAAPEVSFQLPRRDKISFLFHQIDRALKLWQRRGPREVQRSAIRAAEKWMLDRTRYSEGLGAIYPSMMYLIMALEALGYPEDHPDMMEALRRFHDLITESEESLNFQPCFSPVWDTAYAAFALGEFGVIAPLVMAGERLAQTADWLIAREVRHKGDWSVKRPDLVPSGWAFEHQNEHYPDIDDTAMVLLALEHARSADAQKQARCEARAIHWLIHMQSRDGGWAAFDVDNNWAILNNVPFADHNAMLDPTCPDVTGRVLEALSRRNVPETWDAIRQGVQFLLNSQESDGKWWGRWGVDYLYGTFLAMRGLRASGAAQSQDALRRAAQWIASVQNADGGWGESCLSYLKERFVAAPSTPSQTAWAILALLAADDRGTPALMRGLRYLIDTQRSDGEWEESLATGTGFPNVFYLRYTLYRNYFPLMALTLGRRALGRD